MLISVIIPLYNKKDSVKRALDSILNQTYTPLEIIVVNDGSTDGSERIVAELDHLLIRLVHQDNAGVSAARNTGIELSKGDWIAFLDADDFWEKDFLYETCKIQEQYATSSLIFSGYRIFDNYKYYDVKKPLNIGRGICNNYFELAVKCSPPIFTGASVVKKSAILEVDCFNTCVTNGEDLLVWAKLNAHFEIVFIDKVLVNYNLPLNINKHLKLRLPDQNEIVSLELLKLKDLIVNKSEIDFLIKYVAKWHKMRLHQLAQNYKFSLALVEYLKSARFDFFVFKTHLILPTYVIQYLFRLQFKKKTSY
jgi:glycosyltransferase involved in cell wall biosynthesis